MVERIKLNILERLSFYQSAWCGKLSGSRTACPLHCNFQTRTSADKNNLGQWELMRRMKIESGSANSHWFYISISGSSNGACFLKTYWPIEFSVVVELEFPIWRVSSALFSVTYDSLSNFCKMYYIMMLPIRFIRENLFSVFRDTLLRGRLRWNLGRRYNTDRSNDLPTFMLQVHPLKVTL